MEFSECPCERATKNILVEDAGPRPASKASERNGKVKHVSTPPTDTPVIRLPPIASVSARKRSPGDEREAGVLCTKPERWHCMADGACSLNAAGRASCEQMCAKCCGREEHELK